MTTTRNGAPPTWTARATRPLDARHDTDIHRDGGTAVPGIRYETYVTDTGATSRVRVTSTARLAFGDDRSPITATLAHNPPTIELDVRAWPITPDVALELVRALLEAHYIATGERHAVQPINHAAYDVQRMAATDAGGSLVGLPDFADIPARPDGSTDWPKFAARLAGRRRSAADDSPDAARSRAAHALWTTEGTAPAVQTLATYTRHCLAVDQFNDTDLSELAREVADQLRDDVVVLIRTTDPAASLEASVSAELVSAARRVLDDIAEQDRDEDGDERWYVPCGCGKHGDHLACDQRCRDSGDCRHELGSVVTAATEAEADRLAGPA